jgi:nitroreductase
MPGTTEMTSDDLWDVMYSQRAIRHFRADPVPSDLIRRCIEAGTQAPSGSNLQPWAFVVIQNDELRARIAGEVRQRFAANQQLQRYIEEGQKSGDPTRERMMAGVTTIVDRLDSAPVFLIPCLYSPDTAPGKSVINGASVYPAVQNILLAARSVGLGTVMTTFQASMLQQLQEWLNLPENALPVALILLGYPKTKFGPLKRKPADSVTHWDAWQGVRDG